MPRRGRGISTWRAYRPIMQDVEANGRAVQVRLLLRMHLHVISVWAARQMAALIGVEY